MSIDLQFSSINDKHYPCIIAEIGLNHGGSLESAITLVQAAAKAGAHVAKFQLFNSDYFIHPEARLGDGAPGSLQQFFRAFELEESEWHTLAEVCNEAQIDFMCSVFDRPSLELYNKLPVRALKVASCDLSNALLLEDAQEILGDLPWIVSTGTCEEAEIAQLIHWFPGHKIALLQCVSSYPAQASDFNLTVLNEWQTKYKCLCGLSDHSMGLEMSLAAIARGAAIIERHFTLDRSTPGPDHALSLEPGELKSLVRMSRNVWDALHSQPGTKKCCESEKPAYQYGRRSLYAAQDLAAGHTIKQNSVLALRPALEGLAAQTWPWLKGQELHKSKKSFQVIEQSDLKDSSGNS